jgi:hypothetical protein
MGEKKYIQKTGAEQNAFLPAENLLTQALVYSPSRNHNQCSFSNPPDLQNDHARIQNQEKLQGTQYLNMF